MRVPPPPPDVPLAARLRPFALIALLVGVVLVAALLWFWPSSSDATELTAEELAILMEDPPPPTDLPPRWEAATRPSDLRLDTNPIGAAVQLNNEWVGITPIRLDDIKAGFYTLRISKAEYVPRDTAFYLASGSSLYLDVELESLLPPEPAEPVAERSERPPQTSPRRLEQRGSPAGGGTPSTDFEMATPEEVRQTTHTGSLSITSNPSGAIVLLDGNVMGRAPISVNGLSPGSYVVTLTLPGIVPLSYQAEVTAQSVSVVKGDFSVLLEE